MRKTYDMAGSVEDEGSGLPGLHGTTSRLFPGSVATTIDGASILRGANLLRHVIGWK
jgi:hypothetical protein